MVIYGLRLYKTFFVLIKYSVEGSISCMVYKDNLPFNYHRWLRVYSDSATKKKSLEIFVSGFFGNLIYIVMLAGKYSSESAIS